MLYNDNNYTIRDVGDFETNEGMNKSEQKETVKWMIIYLALMVLGDETAAKIKCQ